MLQEYNSIRPFAALGKQTHCEFSANLTNVCF